MRWHDFKHHWRGVKREIDRWRSHTNTPTSRIHYGWFIHGRSPMMDTCHNDLWMSCYTLKNTHTHKSTHLVNAFLLVHHPSAHRTNSRPAFLYTAVKPDPGDPLIYCSSVQESEGGRERRREGVRGRVARGGAGKEGVGRDGNGGERNGGGRGETELLCAAIAPLSMPPSSSLSCFLLPWFLPSISISPSVKERKSVRWSQT